MADSQVLFESLEARLLLSGATEILTFDVVDAPIWSGGGAFDETIEVWQPYHEQPLTREDAIEILMNLGRLTDVLYEPKC